MKRILLPAALVLSVSAAACDSSSDPMGADAPRPNQSACQPASTLSSSAALDLPGAALRPDPVTLAVIGKGEVAERFTSELSVHGSWAYTGTWGARGTSRTPGNALKVWNVSGNSPVLVDSVIISNASTLGDVQVSDDGRLLVVATEGRPGSIVVFDLTNPAKPCEISRYSSPTTLPGVHTAQVSRVNGRLYAFLSVDPSPAQLVIVDLGDPANPREVFASPMGNPFIHDVFVRDGLLFTALWNDGMTIWDIGGAGRGGSPSNPVQISNIRTVGGKVHNIWWYHDPVTGSKRYAFIGEEGPGAIGTTSSGDVHVVDVSDLAQPREVAFYTVPGAGAHNFSVDEASGILYAAFYNGGVRALDIRGDLGTCDAAARAADGRCNLRLMGREAGLGLVELSSPIYVWGVQHQGTHVYASDMLNGLWKLDAASLKR
jgi:hypothetical protein